MFHFSDASRAKLETCDARLQVLFSEVIKVADCKIDCGHRGETEQNAAHAAGRSKVRWPNSRHNGLPSKAADVIPYPVRWGDVGTAEQRRNDIARFYHFAGIVRGIAFSLGIAIRWGGDWDGDLDFNDQHFNDLPHFELEEV